MASFEVIEALYKTIEQLDTLDELLAINALIKNIRKNENNTLNRVNELLQSRIDAKFEEWGK